MTFVTKITLIEFLLFFSIVSMLIIGQVNEFTPFTETGNFRLFPPPMMQIVRHVRNHDVGIDIFLTVALKKGFVYVCRL